MNASSAAKLAPVSLLFSLFLFSITMATSATEEKVTYTIVEENIADTTFSTKVEQLIVVTGIPSKAELETALQKFYNTVMARRFQYHDRATHVWIYIFGTQEQAKADQGLWLGMLSRTDDYKPDITVQEERFSLSERRRKQVYLDLGDAELKAIRIAMARFPDPPQYQKQLNEVMIEGSEKGWVFYSDN